MERDHLETLAEFCASERVSKTTFYYLQRIGRAPALIRIGNSIRISHEAKAAWRQEMQQNPIIGGVRRAAEAAKAEAA